MIKLELTPEEAAHMQSSVMLHSVASKLSNAIVAFRNEIAAARGAITADEMRNVMIGAVCPCGDLLMEKDGVIRFGTKSLSHTPNTHRIVCIRCADEGSFRELWP